MKSIRLFLLLYFLVLIALALGAVSTVVYQTSHKSLVTSQRGAAARVRERFESRSRDENTKLDESLLRQVQHLAALVQNPRDHNRFQDLNLLGILSAALSTQGQAQIPVWISEVTPGPLAFMIHGRTTSTTIHYERDSLAACFPLGVLATAGSPSSLLASHVWTSGGLRRELHRFGQPASIRVLIRDDLLPGNAEGQNSAYCQVAGSADDVWQRSRSLEGMTLALPRTVTEGLAPSQWKLHDMLLKAEVKLRVLTFKSPLPGYLPPYGWWRPRRWRGPGPGGRIDLSGAGPWKAAGGDSNFFIQFARVTAPRDTAIAQLHTELQHDLTSLQDELDTSEAALRSHLLRISLITFAATVLGGFWLVRIGLSPLQRLSEAVSQVSVKDFRLPLDSTRLPNELKPIAERLTQTLDLLKRAFAREKQAAADISHELRTPLSALLTTLEVALRKPRTPEEYRELLVDCQVSGKQMSQLVERLLALARLDAGVDALRPRDVDVAALAEQCASLVRPLAEARDVRLHVHADGPAHLTADPDKLREVITNLLHNAIEYNRPEGSIDLIVQREKSELRVDVRDTGIGIPEAAREHIFERFYRADPSRQADGLHAGLGLAIVKGYVDLMGGTIVVVSAEGEGSTFHLRLPIGGRGASTPRTGSALALSTS